MTVLQREVEEEQQQKDSKIYTMQKEMSSPKSAS